MAVALLAVLAAAAGCGGDGDPGPGKPAPGASAGSSDRPGAMPPRGSRPGTPPPGGASEGPGGRPDGAGPGAGSGSPEDRPGGAGDEEPIRTEVVVTGRGGRLAPARVRVPPFIAVRLVLRSADGGRYGLAVAGRRLTVGPGAPSASLTLAGLGPNGRYDARATAGSGAVAVVASAEPGP